MVLGRTGPGPRVARRAHPRRAAHRTRSCSEARHAGGGRRLPAQLPTAVASPPTPPVPARCFVATNRDPIYPAADDQLFAGAGSIVAAVAVASGRQPDIAVGKPEPGLFRAAAEVGGARVEDAVVIGDNLFSDIAGARNVGARSILMLTGVTTPEMAGSPAGGRPTHGGGPRCEGACGGAGGPQPVALSRGSAEANSSNSSISRARCASSWCRNATRRAWRLIRHNSAGERPRARWTRIVFLAQA